MAKNVFQVHGITEDEEVAFNRALRRAQLLPFFSKGEPCVIGMEAFSSAHHWARELIVLGHDVRLIRPIYVKPYVKRGKSDAIDAEAICGAVTRPTMRFGAIKTVEQQALSSLHRARALLVRQRTQLINGLRGMRWVRGLHHEGSRAGHQFSNGRAFAAWLGLTPANKSSGGKEKPGRITTLSGHCSAMPRRAVNG